MNRREFVGGTFAASLGALLPIKVKAESSKVLTPVLDLFNVKYHNFDKFGDFVFVDNYGYKIIPGIKYNSLKDIEDSCIRLLAFSAIYNNNLIIYNQNNTILYSSNSDSDHNIKVIIHNINHCIPFDTYKNAVRIAVDIDCNELLKPYHSYWSHLIYSNSNFAICIKNLDNLIIIKDKYSDKIGLACLNDSDISVLHNFEIQNELY